jgi:parvulin-like peptidyl-prolyl isomerase
MDRFEDVIEISDDEHVIYVTEKVPRKESPKKSVKEKAVVENTIGDIEIVKKYEQLVSK